MLASDEWSVWGCSRSSVGLLIVIAASLALVSCGVGNNLEVSHGGNSSGPGSGSLASTAPSGKVFGGGPQNPIGGSTVTLYAMGPAGASGGSCSGTSCDGANSLELAQTTSDSSGSFSFSSTPYSCPSGDPADETYITATSGNPGSGTNSAIGLVALAGPCNQLSSSTFVVLNELSTVAAAWSLAQFTDVTGTDLGGPSNMAAGMRNAANLALDDLVTSYVSSGGNTTNTGVPGPFLAAIASSCTGGSPDVNCDGLEKLDTLANILASCINSSGPSSTQCTTLFSNTGTPSTGTTLQAAHAIVTDPTANVAAIFGITPPSGLTLFEPTLSSAPADWTLGLNFDPSGANFSGPIHLAIDASGNVWVTNPGGNDVIELSPSGNLVGNFNNNNTTGANFSGPNWVAIDSSGNVWVTNSSGNSVTELSSSGVAVGNFNNSSDSGANFSSPNGVGINSSGDVWIANPGGPSVTELDSSGALLKNFNNADTSGANFDSSNDLAMDNAGDAWVANQAGNTITELNSAGGLIGDFAPSGANLNSPYSVTTDVSGNAWVPNFGGNSVAEFNPGGNLLGDFDPQGANFNNPYGIAADESGDVWVTNYSGNSLTELSPTGGLIGNFAPLGAGLSLPEGLAIDDSGNVWVANSSGNSVGTLIGLAKAVPTPLTTYRTQENPVPTITSLSPASVAAGATSQTLTIYGRGFVSASTVTYNGVAHTPTLVSSTEVTIQLTSSDLATGGTFPVVVTNPSPGGGSSNTEDFTVTTTVPTITSLSPSGAVAGSAAQTLTILGTNFLNTSTVSYNGVPHTATVVSSTELTIQLTAGDQAAVGYYPVVVSNPAPSGGTSNSLDFAVQAADTLSVIIQGLPSGTSANVTVSGPGGFSQSLTQTATLNGLGAGNYSVVATIVTSSSSANSVDVPVVHGSPALVSTSSAGAINVSYNTVSTNWQPIGPSAIPNSEGVNGGPVGAGKLQAFAISSANPLLMYAGGGVGAGSLGPYTEAGIYTTSNGGASWAQEDSGLTDPSVNALWLDESNNNILVAGTDSSTGGVFLSSNGGVSWSLAGNTPPGPVSAFLLVSGTLYAAAGNGIYGSTDNGANWSLVYSTATVPVRALAAGGGIAYAGLDNGQVLTNASGSWVPTVTQPGSGTVTSIAVNPGNGQNAFVVEWTGSYSAATLYMTTNGGGSWAPVNSPSTCGPSGSGDTECAPQVIAADPSSGYLYASGDFTGVFQSKDNGSTWTQFPSTIWDVKLIIPDAAGISSDIIVGSDQGLFESTDSGGSWQSLAGNITSSILYGIGISGPTVLTTVQDYSPIYSLNGGSTWLQTPSNATSPSGESGSVIFNPGNSQYAYIFSTGGLQYSTDGGQSFAKVSSATIDFNTCSGNGDLVAVDPSSPSTVYVAADNGLFKSTDWGVDWTQEPLPSPPFSSSTPALSMVAVDPTSSSTIFVGTQPSCTATGSLDYTTDGGSNWTQVTLPSGVTGAPTSLAFDPSNPQNVLLGMSAPAPSVGILRSTDGGATFSSAMTGISTTRQTTCQAAAVPHIDFDPSGSGVVAASTNTGLYLSTDLGTNWTSVRGTAVPFAFTQALWSGGYLYASTCGEGILRLPFSF